MTWPPPLGLTSAQLERLDELEHLALHFNEKLNLYSQASAEEFRERHIAHSLALATHAFPRGSVVADWGTGGGMPGLVLAVAFPEVTFHLIDSVGKKIRAVQSMARRLGLSNVEAHHTRAETWQGSVSHSVSRATAPLATLWHWHSRVSSMTPTGAGGWEPGLICLKGGVLDDEVRALTSRYPDLQVRTQALPEWLEDSPLEGKVIVEVSTPR